MQRVAKRSQSYNSDRNTNTVSSSVEQNQKQTDNAIVKLDDRVSLLEASPVMPLDSLTLLYYPCDGLSAYTVVREPISGTNLSFNTTGALFNKDGQVRDSCLRLYGADAVREAVSATVAPATLTGCNAFTVSCWVKFGKFQAANEDYVVSYSNAGLANYSFILCATISNSPTAYPVPEIYVNRAAGILRLNGLRDMGLSPGVWYFLWGTYDGTDASVGVNLTGASTGVGAASAVNWTPGANMRVRAGVAGAVTSFAGQIQELRIDAGVRPLEWLQEAYERGSRRFSRYA